MEQAARPAALAALAVAGLLAAPSAVTAIPATMTEEAMRAAFVGKTLDGHYANGVTWTETYTGDGRLAYRERARQAVGDWYFRGGVFCTFYDEGYRPGLTGGCWSVVEAGANCYEFFTAALLPGEPSGGFQEPAGRWNARAWRRGEPSSCQEKPSV